MSSDPPRLLTSLEATDLEKNLLRSWEDERPSPEARDKLLASLGLATMAAGGIALSSVAPKALSFGWLAIVKWLTIGVVTLGVTVGSVAYVVHDRRAAAQQSPTTAITRRVIPLPQPVNELDEPLATPQATPTHTLHSAPASSSLTQQVAAIDRARSALDAGDTARARRLALAYETEWPAGSFTQEAEVVRLEASLHDGNRAEAERIAKHFLAAYPKSPHAARVRALLGYDP